MYVLDYSVKIGSFDSLWLVFSFLILGHHNARTNILLHSFYSKLNHVIEPIAMHGY